MSSLLDVNNLTATISSEEELKAVLEDASLNINVNLLESGPRGPQGEPGTSEHFAFVIENGDLILEYADETSPPDFKIDSSGDLVYII